MRELTASLVVGTRTRARVPILGGLAVALLGAFLLSLAVGSVPIPLAEVVTVLTGGEPSNPTWTPIILGLRLPKALAAILAGAALAVSGLQMQTLFRNPLADPFILGISAGASLGVALVVLATGSATLLGAVGWLNNLGLVGAAFGGATATLGLVLMLGRWARGTTTLLMLGLMLGYATSGLVSILVYFGVPEQIQNYLNWTFGSFGGVTWPQLGLFAPLIGVGLAAAHLLLKPLNALLLGEAYARSLGVNIGRTRAGVIVSASLLAGTTTAYCGPIAFLGVAVPHLARALLRTADHRALIPATILLGGLIALLADLAARWPGHQLVLPLNAITALIGAPTVAWILVRRGYRSAG